MSFLRKVIPLDAVRSDGWFDRVKDGSPDIAQLSPIVGDAFVAFSLIAGVQIHTLSVDASSPDNSIVEFSLTETEGLQSLTLAEFRARLVSVLANESNVPEPAKFEGESASVEDLHRAIGTHYVLLAGFFGMEMHALHVGGETEASVVVSVDSVRGEIPLSVFWRVLRERVGEVASQGGTSDPFTIDLGRVAQAEDAAQGGNNVRVLELLGAWPGPLSVLLRSGEGRALGQETRAQLARAMGLLGTALFAAERADDAEQALRLGIQWGQEGTEAGPLFRRLAEVFLSSDRAGEAIGLLRHAARLGEADATVMPLLGRALWLRQRRVAAAACFDRALEAGVDAARMEPWISQAQLALGDSWQNFRSLVPRGAETAASRTTNRASGGR